MEDSNDYETEANYLLAETLLKDAIIADRQGQTQEAFDLYQKSLGLWL